MGAVLTADAVFCGGWRVNLSFTLTKKNLPRYSKAIERSPRLGSLRKALRNTSVRERAPCGGPDRNQEANLHSGKESLPRG
ncbi:hypothetical protein NDU88_001365 [Pleurodeles waltl]|uniref:Uncharacterized protein n=1 Tax=Pleurodeles waltl TaxID=8319 RepID=A0AAV7U8A1_PLEWA|nr:hypothetical protein NDU88_001363 [Pleurodeles waltl]KAJ1184559.1 hypothetical protein NDU88_001365 [Pleurodeles waltl]